LYKITFERRKPEPLVERARETSRKLVYPSISPSAVSL
jgi:hypothetical protein